MEPKTIGASSLTILLAVAASVGVTSITTKKPAELPPKLGATTLDIASRDAFVQEGAVKDIHADLRVSVVEGVYGLHWWCNDKPCAPTTAAELDKASADGVSATLVPTQVGEEIATRITVQPGVRPSLPELLPEDAALLGIKSIKAPKEAEVPK